MQRYVRLKGVLSAVEKCNTLVDVGCDHGIFSEMVLKSGLSDCVIACDISLPSLNKAKARLSEYLNASFVCGDGVDLVKNATDTVVISGLGGHEIIKIISGTAAKTLILQPQTRVGDVRRFVYSAGFKIVRDFIVKENGKFYDVIRAEKQEDFIKREEYDFNKQNELTNEQYEWGKFIAEGDGLLRERLSIEQKKLTGFKSTQENLSKLQTIAEVVKKWQR